MSKTVRATISVSTHPATAHIGRYFVDVRDRTGGRNRQVTTRVADEPGVYAFLDQLRAAARQHQVAVQVVDDTGELDL